MIFFGKLATARSATVVLLLLPVLASVVPAVTSAARAQTAPSSVRLAGSLHPKSEEEARILLERVKMAATEVCGASKFSVVEYSRAVRRSPCWQQSVSDAVAHIASPILSDVYGRETR